MYSIVPVMNITCRKHIPVLCSLKTYAYSLTMESYFNTFLNLLYTGSVGLHPLCLPNRIS